MCAKQVDPLRAARVAWRSVGYRYYCSDECRDRDRDRAAPARAELSAVVSRDESSPVVPVPSVAPRADAVREPEPEREASATAATSINEDIPSHDEPDRSDALSPSVPDHAPSDSPAARTKFTESEIDLPEPAAVSGRVPASTTSRVEMPLPPEPTQELPVAPAVVLASALAAQVIAQSAPLGPGAAALAVAPFALASAVLALRSVLRLRALRVARSLAWWGPAAGAVAYLVHASRSGAPAARSLAEFAVLCFVPALSAWLARGALAGLYETHLELSHALATAAAPHKTLRAGEEFSLAEGDAVPADAAVREGDATVARFPGAASASRVSAGDVLLAGARIERGSLRALAVRVGSSTTLARVLRAATRDEAPASTVRWTDRVVLAFPLLCLLVSAVAANAQGSSDALSLLGPAGAALIAAPTVLATVLARIPWRHTTLHGAREGALFHDGASVEAAARVRAVLFCARGTLTSGALELVECVSLGRMNERELVALAASAEEIAAGHPIAEALRSAAVARSLRVEPLRRASSTPSRGVSGMTAGGAVVRLGSRELLLADGVSVARAEEASSAIEAQRRTAVFLSVDERVEAVLGFEDPLRTEARAVAQHLADMGYDLSLMGGGSRGTLEAIGRALDVADVRPEVSPEDRASVVRSVGDVSERVAVVGRPARNATALGAASVSIALGPPRAGAEPSLVLAEEDLRSVPRALARARVARRRAWAVLLACSVGGVACLLVATLPAGAAWVVAVLGSAVAAVASWCARRG